MVDTVPDPGTVPCVVVPSGWSGGGACASRPSVANDSFPCKEVRYNAYFPGNILERETASQYLSSKRFSENLGKANASAPPGDFVFDPRTARSVSIWLMNV